MSLLVFNAGSSTLEFGLIDARAALRQNGGAGASAEGPA
jgi:acetate kinase